MKDILRKVYRTPGNIKKQYLNKVSDVNKSPTFVLGNQKSGTSAIGALLGEATGKPTTIDLEGLHEPIQTKLHNEEIPFDHFVDKNRYDFSKEIIKEPSLTLLYPKLKQHFDITKNVFILRDPRDNIRSILNRVDLPGYLENAQQEAPSKWEGITKNWIKIVDSRWLNVKGDNYIEWMAHRWLLFLDIYERNKDDFILIRYEDFVKNKQKSIEGLAYELNMDVVNNIQDKVDKQFQPIGNRNVDLQDFYGSKNLSRIIDICNEKMHEYGYHM